MSTRSPAPCPHELRPGTTRCLHCRSEARAAARARMRRSAARVGLASVVVAIIAVVANAGTTVLEMGDKLPGPPSPTPAPPTLAAATPTASASPAAAAPAVNAAAHATAPMYAARNAAPAPGGRAVAVQPRLAEGRTELGDSVYAIRTGSGVTVHFDLPMVRTRRADKFEQFVRRTLPQAYGPKVDSVLATIPVGQLASGGDLLTELPRRGIFLRVADGATLAVWPETRPGQDGPLVVRYRATLTR